MEGAYAATTEEVLGHFGVNEKTGLSDFQAAEARAKYGKNGELLASPIGLGRGDGNLWANFSYAIALPEDPPTPLWELVLEQFKDQLVIILLVSAAVSFGLALFEEGNDYTAFVDPAVVSTPFYGQFCSASVGILQLRH